MTFFYCIKFNSYLTYNCDGTYHKAVENHVVNITNMHKQILANHILYAAKLKKTFDQQKVNMKNALNYELGDVVWVDMRKQSKVNKGGTIKWIGHCIVCRVDEGPMYYIEYQTKGSLIKFQKVYHQFMKKFIGEIR